jgi:hypothetical protein
MRLRVCFVRFIDFYGRNLDKSRSCSSFVYCSKTRKGSLNKSNILGLRYVNLYENAARRDALVQLVKIM